MGTEDRVGSMVITDEDRIFEVEVKERGKFRLKIPYPSERVAIGREISNQLGGASIVSVPPESLGRATVLATLSLVIVDSPEWFSGVYRCLDEELLSQLYSEWTEKDSEFRERLKKNQFTRASLDKAKKA